MIFDFIKGGADLSFDISIDKEEYIDTEKEIAAGTNQEIPFEFTIPIDVLPSYKGKNASITYIIKATADRPKKLDVNKKIPFRVLNPNYNTDKTSFYSEKEDLTDDYLTGSGGKGISTY